MNIYDARPDSGKLAARMKRDGISAELHPIITRYGSTSTTFVYDVISAGVFNDIGILIKAYTLRRDGRIGKLLMVDGTDYRLASSDDIAMAKRTVQPI